MKFASVFAIFLAASSSAVFAAPLPGNGDEAVDSPSNYKDWAEYNRNAVKGAAGDAGLAVKTAGDAVAGAVVGSALVGADAVKNAGGAVAGAVVGSALAGADVAKSGWESVKSAAHIAKEAATTAGVLAAWTVLGAGQAVKDGIVRGAEWTGEKFANGAAHIQNGVHDITYGAGSGIKYTGEKIQGAVPEKEIIRHD